MDVPPATPTPPTSPDELSEPKPRAVTLRSVLLGLIGVILICGFTPYNDFAVANTFAIGNFLPILLVLFVIVVVLAINLPLRLVAPRVALREGELAVVVAMLLVSCSLPSSGLMRYLPAGLVGVYSNAANNAGRTESIDKADLPTWLFPATTNDDPNRFKLIDEPALTPTEIGSSPVYRYYLTRLPEGEPIPWMAWVRPFAVWGLFLGLVWGLVLFLCVIVRRQWAENERLAFPLATVYSALIEAPEQGRLANALFRSRGFWIAAIAVFVLHGFNGLHEYVRAVPEIPRGFNLSATLRDPPFSYMTGEIKVADIYFCIVGIAFFVQTKITFSIWFFFVLMQGATMMLEGNQVSFTNQMKQDQTFGGMMVLAGVILWVGRHHWWLVIRHMFGQARPDEKESRYLPYWFAGWGAAACFAGIITWMVWIGVSLVGAVCITMVLTMAFMLTARILAETGLAFVQINWPMYRLWYYPLLIPDEPIRTTPTTFFVAGWITHLFHDLREAFSGFFITGLRVADQSAYERSHRWRTGVSFIGAIVLALVVGYVVSAAATVWTEYKYASTLATPSDSPLNIYGVNTSVLSTMLDRAPEYANAQKQPHNMSLNIGIGAVVTALCAILRLNLAWWPLHPIGFVLLYSYAAGKIWFSLLIGWIAKVAIVRLGGASLLRSGRNVFIGLIVGEAFAASFWLVFSLIANWTGHEYHRIMLLPG